MSPGLSVLAIFLVAGVACVLTIALERRLRRPGLGFALVGANMVVGAGLGFANGDRLLPTLFAFQAVSFFAMARWRYTESRARVDVAPDPTGTGSVR